jgi:hypothetical protein
MKTREIIGRAAGFGLAPVVALGARARRARLFHPDGVVYRAEVTESASIGAARDVAARLVGPALVRLSSAWWRGGKEWPDVLGLAIRFRRDTTVTAEPAPGDQDLLFATIRWPWTTLLAPLATYPGSFLWNNYHAVSPFEIEGFGRAKLRLISPHLVLPGGDRLAKLERAVDRGAAAYELQARRLDRPGGWEDVARITLRERVEIDQAALRMWPFRAGRGIVPRGFVNALRLGAYRASQRARPSREAA